MFNKSFWKIRKKRKSYAVTSKPTMISTDGRKTPIKMAGYLEKKSKMRVVCRWKKLWFVLEGRLLLYYKSQLEYLSLSPCRGTVNMGLAASVIPGKSNEIIVSTRSTTVSLRALNRGDHDIWLQALMDAMCMPNLNHAGSCKKPVHHFRYSTGGLDHTADIKADVPYSGTNKGVESLSPLYMKTSSNVVNVSVTPAVVKSKSTSSNEQQEPIPAANDVQKKTTTAHNGLNRIPSNYHDNKVDRLGRKLSKVAVSDTSIPGKFKLTSNEGVKTPLRRSASVEEDVNRYSENIYESLKDVNKFESNIINKQTRKFVTRVNRSDSDCLMMIGREKINKVQSPFRSEQRIMTSGSPPLPVYERYGDSFYFRRPEKHHSADDKDKLYKLKQKYNATNRQNYVKEIKSDTDLTVRRHRYLVDDAKHYGALYKPTALTKRNSESYDFSNLQEIVKDKTRGPLPIPINPASLRQSKPTRSNSILRNFSRLKQNDINNSKSCELTKRNSVKKKSLSFLRKIWKRKDDSTKWEIDSFSSELNIQFQEMQGPSSDFDNISDFSVNDASLAYDVPLPEPPPDYDQVHVIDDEFDVADEPPALPPRLQHTRPASPPHDRPVNNKPIIVNADQDAPALPVKMRKLHPQNNQVALDYLFYENTDPGLRYLFQEEENLNNQEYAKESNTVINNNNNNDNDDDLGEMLSKLNEINNTPLVGFHLYENGQNSCGVRKDQHGEDPDYDVPRPHVSLLTNLRKESYVMDSLPATNFFNHYEDSLDVNNIRDRYEDFTMAPDSLECDPWSLSNEAEVRSESWSLSCDLHEPIKSSMSDRNLNHDSLYHADSLNPPLISHRLTDYIHLQQNGFIQLHS